MNSEENKPLDLISTFPPKQEGVVIQNSGVRAFALSLQGASHIARDNTPCQDYSDIRWLEGAQILIAAIADGVGSCALSHWGAYYAVTAAMDSIEKSITAESGGRQYELTDIPRIQEILIDAFHAAQTEVEEKADEALQPVFNFQSTLTVAVYDGTRVFCCHCGDDGAVIQEQDGTVRMVTKRLKGEEASSVYPLQSGPAKWQVTGAKNPVAGFVMATDGVLDAFVPVFEDYYHVNYNQGIYYPFMKQAIYGMAADDDYADPVKETLKYYKEFFDRPEYRSQVSDDLTLVSVISPKLLKNAVEPRFNAVIWKAVYEEHGKAIKVLLEGKALDEKANIMPDVGMTTASDRPPKAEKSAAESEKPEQKETAYEKKTGGTPKLLWLLSGVLTGAILVGIITSVSSRTKPPETAPAVTTGPVAAVETKAQIHIYCGNPECRAQVEQGDLYCWKCGETIPYTGRASASEAEKASASQVSRNGNITN